MERKSIMKSIRFRLLGFTLILLMLTSVFISVQPYTSATDPITITWLMHWTEPFETAYWDGVIAEYEAMNPGIDIVPYSVDISLLQEEIELRHASGTDTDIINMHCSWLPTFAGNWKDPILAKPPKWVRDDVKDNWTDTSVVAATYKSIVYGYPTEYNSWALVYNRELFAGHGVDDILAKLEADIPITWEELETAARACTTWNDGTIDKTGFSFYTGYAEGEYYEFLSLLWSNGGEYVDLTVPTTLFSDASGYEAMQLLHDLGYVEPRAYDPLDLPDIWWDAWVNEEIAIVILPTWMGYIRWAMGENFSHLGVAPIPIGPHGTKSMSPTYCWMVGVTEASENKDAAWAFLKWLNDPRPAGYINIPPIIDPPHNGVVPQYDGTSIMGEFLIYDSYIPSRTSDLEDPRLTASFWFKGFKDMGTQYGRSDKAFWKQPYLDAQTEIGIMFERVTLLGWPPVIAVDWAEAAINPILPLPGDIDIDGDVDIYDYTFFAIDFIANPVPCTPEWHRGRSDLNDDGVVDRFDAIIMGLSADVAVTNVKPYKTVVGQGYSTDVNVTVENEGDFDETFNVNLYANLTSIGTPQTVTDLAPDDQTTLTFTWDTSGFANGNYTISAYATPVPGETDTADNNFTDGTVMVTQSVAVQPEVIIGPPPKISETFTVNITIANVTDLYIWQAGMTFNPSVLEAVSIAEGEFLKRAGVTTLWTPGSIDNIHGIIHYSACALTGSTPGVDGSGQLMNITFRVKDNGNSALNLTDVVLLNSTLMPIKPVYIVDGYVEIHLQDIAILSVATSATEAYPTWIVPLNITVVVENQGTKTETFNVTVYANTIAIETKTVTLAAGKNTTLVYNWNLASVAEGTYTIKAEASVLYGEIDTADNIKMDGTVKIKHPGDANGDGVVNAYDLGILAKAWLTKVGDPLYDARADFNGDGKIDEKDHGILKAYWP